MATEGGVLGVIRAARPQFRSAHDRIAFAVHAIFQSAGYALIAVGSRVSPDLPVGDEQVEEVGIECWNDMDGAYAFLYSGTGQEGLCKFVLVKCLAVEDKLIVAVTNENDKEALQLEIRVPDYVTTSEGTNYGQLYKRLNELVEQVNSSLLSKLSCSKDEGRISSKVKEAEDVSSDENVRQSSILVDERAPSMLGKLYGMRVLVFNGRVYPTFLVEGWHYNKRSKRWSTVVNTSFLHVDQWPGFVDLQVISFISKQSFIFRSPYGILSTIERLCSPYGIGRSFSLKSELVLEMGHHHNLSSRASVII